MKWIFIAYVVGAVVQLIWQAGLRVVTIKLAMIRVVLWPWYVLTGRPRGAGQ